MSKWIALSGLHVCAAHRVSNALLALQLRLLLLKRLADLDVRWELRAHHPRHQLEESRPKAHTTVFQHKFHLRHHLCDLLLRGKRTYPKRRGGGSDKGGEVEDVDMPGEGVG